MISAVDTNILLDILRPNPSFLDSSSWLLESSSQHGSLVVCEIVYAELSAHFDDRERLDEFLEDCLIVVDPLGRAEAFQAGRLWRVYRQAGGKRERIISDFLIGAHALGRSTRLLSRDRGFYRNYFPNLTVIDPSASPR